ncbi:hypothetical protein RCL1_003801 [Eukaryota sp. TZLM3-RCL]
MSVKIVFAVLYISLCVATYTTHTYEFINGIESGVLKLAHYTIDPFEAKYSPPPPLNVYPEDRTFFAIEALINVPYTASWSYVKSSPHFALNVTSRYINDLSYSLETRSFGDGVALSSVSFTTRPNFAFATYSLPNSNLLSRKSDSASYQPAKVQILLQNRFSSVLRLSDVSTRNLDLDLIEFPLVILPLSNVVLDFATPTPRYTITATYTVGTSDDEVQFVVDYQDDRLIAFIRHQDNNLARIVEAGRNDNICVCKFTV